MDEDLAFAPALTLSEKVAAKEVSPVELTELFLRRIERLDGRLNSYLTLVHDEAMAAAKVAEEAVMHDDALGPLHGVPISLKDMQMTRGIRTTQGCAVYGDRIPTADSAVAERVRGSGAIVLGKTNTPEFGMLGATENRLGDECRNPWDAERTSGGSSGGAASALAAGLCPLATGGDGGGSIRIPASFCGVYGIKPTQGRVSSYTGVPATATNLTSQQGPMSRTVRDSALLLQVLAGHDPRDPGSLRDAPDDYLAAADRGVSGLRIAWSPDFGYASVDPEVAEVAAGAVAVFQELGCSVEESNLALESPLDTWWTIFCASGYASYGHLLDDHADELTWYGRMCIEAGRDVTGAGYAKALGQRDVMRAQIANVFDKADLLVSPTMPVPAFPVQGYPESIGGRKASPSPAWGFIPFTHPINTVGYTAASVPCGFSSDGMPIGLHIVGREGDESTVIAASAAFEEARPWADARPAVSS
jgi:aspartyl-tRNA(Asn)/glutamyl-tRNA(Gln) amidotransferase subunit A